MKYVGSKNRIAKYILPIILKNRGFKPYIEPFVGGGNTIDKVEGVRLGYDVNKYTVEALISIRDSIELLPKNSHEFTEEDYKRLRLDDTYPYKGYAGFAFSYGGKWMGGWRRDRESKRDYVNEAYRNALKQHPKLQGVSLNVSDYSDILLDTPSVVYCDPPYKGTTKYATSNFNYPKFWSWCRALSKEGHTLFISEYEAPDDFLCLFNKQQTSSLTQNTGSKIGVERLFTYEPTYLG